MRRHFTAKRAWTGFVVWITAYEMLCIEDELMSRGMDKFRERHPILAWYFVLATAGHLLRIIPKGLDVYQVPPIVAKRLERIIWDAQS